jgi:hypothetical protein
MTTTKTTQPGPTGTSGAPTARERVAAALAAHPGATIADLSLAAGTGHSTTGKALAALEKAGHARREKGGRDHNNRATPDRWHPTTPGDATPTSDTSTDTATQETPVPEPRAETDNTPVDIIAQDDGPMPEPEPAVQGEQTSATTTDTCGESGASTADTGTPPSASASEGSSISWVAEAPVANETAMAPAPTTSSGRAARLAPGALRQMVIEHLTAHPEEAFTATAISRVIERSSGAIANALATLTRQGIACQVNDHPRRYQLATTLGVEQQ